MKNADLHTINLLPLTEEKSRCRLVYRTELGKVVSTQGIIRDLFKTGDQEVAILENGLPIPIRQILSIRRMEA